MTSVETVRSPDPVELMEARAVSNSDPSMLPQDLESGKYGDL